MVNRTVIQHRLRDPGEALIIERARKSVPASGEQLIELVMAPVNPAEVLMLQGRYGASDAKPVLPRAAACRELCLWARSRTP